MNIFKRIFKVGQAEAHSAIDALENPIKMTEQGIRDMKADLDKALHALAEVKALAIRSKNDLSSYKNKGADYERKAMQILQKAEAGGMTAADADRLAGDALLKKQECDEHTARLSKEVAHFDKQLEKLEGNVRTLRHNISKWENELKTLKARQKVASTTKNLNKQMAQIDSSSTISMLERMKDKVAEEESLAEAYGDIANENRSVDEEIDSALKDEPQAAASDALAALKAKMNGGKAADSSI